MFKKEASILAYELRSRSLITVFKELAIDDYADTLLKEYTEYA